MSNVNPDLLNFACPTCQKKLRAPLNLAGQKLVCPKCSSPIRVPGVVESKSDDDDWLSLDSPSEPKNVPTPISQPVSRPKKADTPTPAPIPSPPSATAAPDEFRLAPVEQNEPKTSNISSTATTNQTSTASDVSSPKTAGRSVFDDDLPELLPADEPLVVTSTPPSKPKLKSTQATKPISKPELNLPDIQLPDFGKEDFPLAPLESETLIGPAASVDNEEFSFHCKLCGSLLSSRRSQIGTKTSCPDCYSKFRVPNSPPKRKQTEVKLDEELASVTFAPIDSISVHGTNSTSVKTKEILERAEQSVAEERDEFEHLSGSFDTMRWMGFLFGFLRDPLVVAAGVAIGFVVGIWFFSMSALGTWIEMNVTMVYILRLGIICVFSIPIIGTICMCGIAVLTMAANRTTKVVEWPFSRLSESIGECAMVVASIMAASIPGGIIFVVSSSLNAHSMVSLAFVLFGIWGLTPILLLCMIDNNSIFEPYSKAVLNSTTSHTEAWGAMYIQTAVGFVMFFLFMVMTSMQRPVGDFILGLALPFACFFLFNQYGVLAGRISQVTEMGFEGDFSDG